MKNLKDIYYIVSIGSFWWKNDGYYKKWRKETILQVNWAQNEKLVIEIKGSDGTWTLDFLKKGLKDKKVFNGSETVWFKHEKS